jgi:hypothetical protein
MGTLRYKDRIFNWKTRSNKSSKEVRQLRQENKRLLKKNKLLNEANKALKKSRSGTKLTRHIYPLELVWLGVYMHITLGVSLRSSAAILRKIGELYCLKIGKISGTTIRNWSMRFGLYCYTRLPIKKDCFLILDESVEIGQEHLLVILAVPISERNRTSPLKLTDVSVLKIGIQKSWNGSEISEAIEQAKQEHGLNIKYGVSDGDSTLKDGLNRQNIPWVSDCTHVIANGIKKLYYKDEDFNGLIKMMNVTRSKWVLSQNSIYLPPGLRAKARFHQILTVYQWAEKILLIWDKLPEVAKQELQYVKDNVEIIATMKQLHELIKGFSDQFKVNGIKIKSRKRWDRYVIKWRRKKLKKQGKILPKVSQFLTILDNYLDNQSKKLPQEKQVICCSDVIESLFGKYKNKGGAKLMTDDILTIAAYPKDITQALIKEAFHAIKMKDEIQWKNDFTIPSMLALGRKLWVKPAA